MSPTSVWLSGSSARGFRVRAGRDAGQSLPLWFSVMHSLAQHSRRISLHPHIFPSLCFFPSSSCLRAEHHKSPAATNTQCCFRICKCMVKFRALDCCWWLLGDARRQPPLQSCETSTHNTAAVMRSLIWCQTFHTECRVLMPPSTRESQGSCSWFYEVLMQRNVIQLVTGAQIGRSP